MNYEEQIEEIMDWFDFRKVKNAMDALEWKWGLSGSVPEEGEIRSKARKILREVAKAGPDNFCYTGGLKAECDKWGQMRLSFLVEDWRVEPKD